MLALLSSLAQAAPFLKVVPGKILNYELAPAEKSRMLKAFAAIEVVINSEEFRERVMKYPRFTSNNKLTNEQIYEKILSGAEMIGGDQSLGEMNFDISRYLPILPSSVVGRTYPGVNNTIEVNGKKYAYFSSSDMAGNITHEWIHLLGFIDANSSDTTSVPYAVGYIMDELVAKYLKQGFLH